MLPDTKFEHLWYSCWKQLFQKYMNGAKQSIELFSKLEKSIPRKTKKLYKQIFFFLFIMYSKLINNSILERIYSISEWLWTFKATSPVKNIEISLIHALNIYDKRLQLIFLKKYSAEILLFSAEI